MKTIRQTTFRSHCGGAAALAIAVLLFAGAARAQVPLLLNYQGRVAVGTTNFNGTGQFRFALVNTNGTTTFWSNDGTSTAGSQMLRAMEAVIPEFAKIFTGNYKAELRKTLTELKPKFSKDPDKKSIDAILRHVRD